MPHRFEKLESLVSRLPAINSPVTTGFYEDGLWWVKFSIDLHHSLTWNVVQMLAYSINYLSISERLSTSFYPMSTSPFDGCEPEQCMYWIIESTSQDFVPDELAIWLESRLPDPDDLSAWSDGV